MDENGRLTPKEREKLINLVKHDGYKVRNACQRMGVSQNTYYVWEKRNNYESRSCAPLNPARKAPDWLEEMVVQLRKKEKLSSIKIHKYLKEQNIINPSTRKNLSETGVREIFKRYNLSRLKDFS